MRRVETVPGLSTVLAAEVLQFVRAEQYVSWAQNALSMGIETASILRLAIEEPPYFTPDLQKQFAAILTELDVERITDHQAMVLYGQEVVQEFLDGRASARNCARRMAGLFPSHLAPDLLADWWQLDEAYDCDYCRLCVLENAASLEIAIEKAARDLITADWRAA